MITTGFASPDIRPFLTVLDSATGPKQLDRHVCDFRAYERAGGAAGQSERDARRAAAEAEAMQTAEGRAYLARVAAHHAAWRKEWGR